MTEWQLVGKAWKYGNNISTDLIMPSRYLTKYMPFEELGKVALEALDRDFSQKIQKGDIVVAGVNFGCGSAREEAPLALKSAGVGAVLAESFARIFYRNAINVALPVIQCSGILAAVEGGDELEVNIATGKIVNKRTGKILQGDVKPDFILEILADDGLLEHLKKTVLNTNSPRE